MTDKALGLLLFQVSRAHHNLASQVFEQLGLHRGQPPVLFELGRQDGITQSELAERMEVRPATLTNMLQRMEAAGFITRCRDQADSRVSRVYLTQAGKDVLVRARELANGMDHTAFAGFSSAEKGQIKDFLERIHASLITALEEQSRK
ncbi:MAG: MarR family transcriptional regulator [Chloroflexi bacterium]|jgi:DNA-binding MarR family transcriptional regulator|nr:MarR family transcriptional regulator [Anaerolineaceae bacterium]NMB89696.1 MarR family transcriptional regulator [Chloroflexota bacterium]